MTAFDEDQRAFIKLTACETAKEVVREFVKNLPQACPMGRKIWKIIGVMMGVSLVLGAVGYPVVAAIIKHVNGPK